MKYTFTALFNVLFLLAVAQPPGDTFPDFTETDILGNEHSLYEDYLDQGKTVVIDIFATWCPLCTNSLPGLHALEEEFEGELVFLSFENDAGTSNEADWADNYNVTSPIFANSTELMSTWNTVFQPNYFVICPDGSFQLKVGGVGNVPEPLNEFVTACPTQVIDNVTEVEPVEFYISTNPVTMDLTFVSNSVKGDYEVVSLTGQTVSKGSFETASTTLDASALETGLYFLKISSGNSSSVKKFIKN